MKPVALNPQRLTPWVDLTLKVASIFGGLFVLYQYMESQHQIRVSRTLEYVQKLDDPSSRLGSAYAALSSALQEVERSIERYNSASLSKERAQHLRARFIQSILERRTQGDRNVAADLNDVVVFHELLQNCLENRLCDLDTAREFFLSDAKKLWLNFEVHFRNVRRTDPDFADGLEQFISEQ